MFPLIHSLLLSSAFAQDPVPTDVPPDADPPAEEGAPISFPEALPPSSSGRSENPLLRVRGDGPDVGPSIAYGVGYGMYVGATSGWLAGEATERREQEHTTEGIVPGALIGGAIGGGTAYLVARKQPLSADGAVHMSSSTALGALAGGHLGAALIPLDEAGAYERSHAAALAGSIAGAGVGLLTIDNAPAAERTAAIDLAAGMGYLAATGISDMAGFGWEQRNARSAVALAGISTMAVAGVFGTSEDRPVPSGSKLGLAMAHGAWIGAMSPYLFDENPDARDRTGGLRLGLGLGYGLALATSHLEDPSPRSMALQALGATAGNALGAGIPLSIGGDKHTRWVVGPALAGGLAGQAFGAAVAPHFDLSPNQLYTLGILQGWAVGQSIGWTAWASEYGPSERAAGYGLATVGAGTLVAIGVSPLVDMRPSSSTLMLTSGGWGTFVGVTGATALGMDSDAQWMSGLIGGNVAVVGVGALAAAGVEPSWSDVGTINGMTALGTAAGGLAGVIFLYEPDDWRPMMGAASVGTLVGAGTGVALSIASPDRDLDVGLRLPEVRGRTTAYAPRLAVKPWSDTQGNPGAYLELDVTEVIR